MAEPAGRSTGIEVDAGDLLKLRPLAMIARTQGRGRTSALPGPFVTRRRGRGSEVDEVRLWAHGDDMRHIDRNSTARTGKPHVRTFRDERDQTLLLLADFRAPMLFGTRRVFRSVAAADALALAGWRTIDEGGRVGLVAIGGPEPLFTRPAVGERAMIAIAGTLATAHRAALDAVPAPVPPLSEALATADRALRRAGTLVVATALDDPGPDFDAVIAEARRRHDISIALISDAFERTAPTGRYPFVTTAGRSGLRLVGGQVADGRSDPRIARLTALGVRVIVIPAEAGPEATARSMEGLHGR